MEDSKPIHTLVLDAGPLIKNTPSVSSLLASSTALLTHPAVISEIRDEATRTRLETTLRPFLTLREPKPESIKFIRDFARRSGDLEVLSRPDVLLLALTYEVECERNGGDWRLRRTPGQKGVNGKPPAQEKQAEAGSESMQKDGVSNPAEDKEAGNTEQEHGPVEVEVADVAEKLQSSNLESGRGNAENQSSAQPAQETSARHANYAAAASSSNASTSTSAAAESIRGSNISPRTRHPDTAKRTPTQPSLPTPPPSEPSSPTSNSPSQESSNEEDPDDDNPDEGGWITPSNLHHHQTKDALQQSHSSTPFTKSQKPTSNTGPPNSTISSNNNKQPTLQSALLTTDHAMQNVALLLNLNLLSTDTLTRITQLKTTTHRCHACFFVLRPRTPAASPLTGGANAAAAKAGTQKAPHFCPQCGLPTLTRVTCSTSSATGKLQIHLKKNMQWNTKGDRFAVPKPVAGSAGARGASNVKGGGKGGWGSELLLAEDQKEYVRAVREEERVMRRMNRGVDEDFGGLFGGDGGRSGRRVKVGVGRDVNSRRRK